MSSSYEILCSVQSTSDIYVDSSGKLHCDNGTIQIVPAPLLLADLTQDQIGSLFGAVLALFAVAFIFRQLRIFIFNRS